MAEARTGLHKSVVAEALQGGHLKLGEPTGPTWRSYPLKEESVARARRFARQTLAGIAADDEDHYDSALIVVSELVTNAVIHTAGDGLHLGIAPSDRWTHIHVIDPDPDAPVLGFGRGRLATSGRGLAIVHNLAERFGFVVRAYDKTAHAVLLRADVVLTEQEHEALDLAVSR